MRVGRSVTPVPAEAATAETDLNSRTPAAVHVDLDGLVDIMSVHGWPYPYADDPLFETGVANALELLDRNGLKATFFVVARSLDDPAKRRLVTEAVARGHEIASHSLTHALMTRLGRAGKVREIAGSRQRIEDALGTPVRGFRAPGYLMDRESMDLLVDAGYLWDSSAHPTRVFARRLGVSPAALSTIGRPYADSPLIELPLPDFRPLPFPFSPSYSLILGASYFRVGLRLAERRGTPFILLYHLTDFADPVPRSRQWGWRSRIVTLSFIDGAKKRRACAKMLDLVLQRFEAVTTNELLYRGQFLADAGQGALPERGAANPVSRSSRKP